MNCPRCAKQVPANAAFCMHCGQALVSAAPQTTQMPRPVPFAPVAPQAAPAGAGSVPAGNLSAAFDQQRRRTTVIAIALGVLAAVCAVGFGLKSLGFLGENAKTPEEAALIAKSKLPGAALVAVGRTPDVPLAAVATAPAEMPDDIYQWLEHLRKSEEKRAEITMSQLTTAYTEKEKSQVAGGVDALKDLLNGIDDPNSELHSPTEKLGQVIKQMHDQCHDVLVYFDSVKPPEECVAIKNAYDQALNEEAAQMGDIADHLAAGDMEKLLKMEGKSASGIDSAGEKTDRLVGEICDKYHKRRWFNIATDIKSSPIFGSGF